MEASKHENNLMKLQSILHGEHGEDGRKDNMVGKSGNHLVAKVPIGTIIRNTNGKIVGDLNVEGSLFIAARGGAGGKGNAFFKSNAEQTPKIAEQGAHGENLSYRIELKSMAHLGLVRCFVEF